MKVVTLYYCKFPKIYIFYILYFCIYSIFLNSMFLSIFIFVTVTNDISIPQYRILEYCIIQFSTVVHTTIRLVIQSATEYSHRDISCDRV